MIPRILAEKHPDGSVQQGIRFRVESTGKLSKTGGWESHAVVGDFVFVNAVAHCPAGTVGQIRCLGQDGFGRLIVSVRLFKRYFSDWPRKETWVYPDELHLAFVEE